MRDALLTVSKSKTPKNSSCFSSDNKLRLFCRSNMYMFVFFTDDDDELMMISELIDADCSATSFSITSSVAQLFKKKSTTLKDWLRTFMRGKIKSIFCYVQAIYFLFL